MDATPTNNCSVLLRTTVTHSQNTPGCMKDERFIRIVSGGNKSNFENLLEKSKEITIYQRNLQVLMIKVYKVINGYAPPIMGNIFIFRENTHS